MNGFEEMEMTRRLLALEKPKAKERQKAHGNTAPGKKRKNTPETVSEVKAAEGEALQQVASAVGVSAPSIRKGLAAAA